MRHIATLGLAAGVLVAGMLTLRSMAALAEALQVWRGYYTLIVHEDSGTSHAPARVAQRLRDAGFGTVVSAATATERVTTFGGYERVAIADLTTRLDELDPRYDPYLRRVADWFTTETEAGAAQLVYVASSLPPGYVAIRLGRALGSGDIRWRIAELPWQRTALALLLFAAGVVLQIVRRDPHSPRWWRLLLALPWALLIVHGELPAAFVAVPAYLAGVWLAGPVTATARRPWRGRWRSVAATPAVLLGVAVLGFATPQAGGDSASLPAVLLAGDLRRMALYLMVGGLWFAALTGAGLTVRGLAAAGAWLRTPERRRRPRRSAPSPSGPRRRLAGFGSSVVVCLIGVSIVLFAARGEPLPRPVPVPASAGFALAALPALGPGGPPELPALSDYVAHAAYQETLQFGRPYALPAPGERVTVDQYRRASDARVLHETVEVAHFSDRWLHATLAAVPRTSLPALLIAQGHPVTARHEPPASPAGGEVMARLALTLLLAAAMIGRRRWQARRPPGDP